MIAEELCLKPEEISELYKAICRQIREKEDHKDYIWRPEKLFFGTGAHSDLHVKMERFSTTLLLNNAVK